MVMIDHHDVGAEDIFGRENFVAYRRAFAELLAGARVFTVQYRALAPDHAVAEMRQIGTTDEGAEIERSFIGVVVLRDGLYGAFEQFPIDRLSDALARFEELRDQQPAADPGT